MYVFGGKANSNVRLNDMWRFDFVSETWEEVQYRSDPPLERSGHSCSLYGEYLVIFGGFFEITKELNDLYLFDLA